MLGDAHDLLKLLESAGPFFQVDDQGSYRAPAQCRVRVAEASANLLGVFTQVEKLVRSGYNVPAGSKTTEVSTSTSRSWPRGNR